MSRRAGASYPPRVAPQTRTSRAGQNAPASLDQPMLASPFATGGDPDCGVGDIHEMLVAMDREEALS